MKSRTAPRPVVVLISGRGSNMRALVEHSQEIDPSYRVVRVISDRADAPGLETAQALGVAAAGVVPTQGTERGAYDRILAAAIDAYAPALIVLAGFMRILSAEFVDRYAGRILNIHPSLLPKYPGLHTHRKVLAAREARHGATVHFVTAQLDGGPRIIQAHVDVAPDDDEASLAARVQSQEHRIYPLAVDWFCEGRLQYRDDRAWLDGNALKQPVPYDAGESSRGG